ncbi:MAG: exosome complex RNA-binding protein Rrp4 [Methanotrichaceae archaeon]
MDRNVVIPGDKLSENPNNAGDGTYVKDGKVYSRLYGLTSYYKDKVKVIPLAGKYIPSVGDTVIGTVNDITFSNWIIRINSPYEGLLHISEFPKKIEMNDMSKYLWVGSSVIAKVKDVDSTMKVELTLNDQRLGTLKRGRVIEISPTKVPRLIGKSGSMIDILNRELNCKIFVGQNGGVWIDGGDENMDLALKAIHIIETEAHTTGLTDRISKFLKTEKHG